MFYLKQVNMNNSANHLMQGFSTFWDSRTPKSKWYPSTYPQITKIYPYSLSLSSFYNVAYPLWTTCVPQVENRWFIVAKNHLNFLHHFYLNNFMNILWTRNQIVLMNSRRTNSIGLTWSGNNDGQSSHKSKDKNRLWRNNK